MSKKIKLIIIFLTVFVVLSIAWFNLFFINRNANLFEEQLKSAGRNSDVIIVFNSGGWGTVPFDRAFDFNPVINNIKSYLENQNYNVSIVPYYRTEENIFARIASIKELLSRYPDVSGSLADKINDFLKEQPDKKVILAGPSNGASLVDSTMNDIGPSSNVLGIEFGEPFSKDESVNDNILLINNEKDALAQGELWPLASALIKSPFVYIASILQGKYISYSEAIKIDGHDYPWPLVKADITLFLERKLD